MELKDSFNIFNFNDISTSMSDVFRTFLSKIELTLNQINASINTNKEHVDQKIEKLNDNTANDITEIQKKISSLNKNFNENIQNVESKVYENIKDLDIAINDLEKKITQLENQIHQTIKEEISSNETIIGTTIDISEIKKKYTQIEQRIKTIVEKFSEKNNILNKSLKNTKTEFTENQKSLNELLNTTKAELLSKFNNKLLFFEKKAFLEQWSGFETENSDLLKLAENISSNEMNQFKRDISAISKSLESLDNDLNSQLNDFYAPLKDNMKQLNRLNSIKKKQAEFKTDSTDNHEKQFYEIRECSLRLISIQNNMMLQNDINIDKWIKEKFIKFADLFLLEYQKNYQDTSKDEWKKLHKIVKDILNKARLDPFDIILGKTPFDDDICIGRETDYNTKCPNNTIVGVIKNGFCILDTNTYIQQPEVIVNKID